jgi:hypothetical protein
MGSDAGMVHVESVFPILRKGPAQDKDCAFWPCRGESHNSPEERDIHSVPAFCSRRSHTG